MTRIASGSDIKRGAVFVRGEKPREGTKLRDLYDRLRAGEIVKVGGNITHLRDMYGMEIEAVYTKGKRGSSGSRLIGEWDGPYFVPVERLGQSE